MTERIKIDPRRLLGVRITVDPTATVADPQREAVTAAKTGAKVGQKARPKPI